jgi:hypothetical protein
MTWQTVADLAWQINLLVVCAVITRMTQLGLWTRFPVFLLDRGMAAGFGCLSFFISTTSAEYCNIYLYSRPLDLLVLSLAAREVFRAVYRTNSGLPALIRSSRRAAIGCAMLAALIAIPFTYPKWSCADFQCRAFVFLELQRAVMLGTGLYLTLMLRGLRVMKVPLDRNTQIHARLLASLMFVQVGVQVVALVTKGQELLPLLNLALMMACGVLNACWLTGLQLPSLATVPMPQQQPAVGLEQRLMSLDCVLHELLSQPHRAPQRFMRLVFETRKS